MNSDEVIRSAKSAAQNIKTRLSTPIPEFSPNQPPEVLAFFRNQQHQTLQFLDGILNTEPPKEIKDMIDNA